MSIVTEAASVLTTTTHGDPPQKRVLIVPTVGKPEGPPKPRVITVSVLNASRSEQQPPSVAAEGEPEGPHVGLRR
jgi:hypothetical protein